MSGGGGGGDPDDAAAAEGGAAGYPAPAGSQRVRSRGLWVWKKRGREMDDDLAALDVRTTKHARLNGAGLNGLAIRSWGDLLAAAAVLALFIGILQWGLKLEARNDVLQEKVNELQVAIAKDILPRADERISYHDKELAEIRRRLNVIETDRK